MRIGSPRQLKDWISNIAKSKNLVSNTVLQNFMMERMLERISISKYNDFFILKGGFLIAAMVGLDLRSTLDMDTTVKGMQINLTSIETILNEILSLDIDDNVTFKIKGIKKIHDISDYDDFRVSVEASFFSICVNLKIDITTGDLIIPHEIDFKYKLMFEDRYLAIKAYNLNTILAEKIESILARNIANTRARDYYDVYIIMKLHRSEIQMTDLRGAIYKKAEDRGTLDYYRNSMKYLEAILDSHDMRKIWGSYETKYPYAADISFEDILSVLKEILISH